MQFKENQRDNKIVSEARNNKLIVIYIEGKCCSYYSSMRFEAISATHVAFEGIAKGDSAHVRD